MKKFLAGLFGIGIAAQRTGPSAPRDNRDSPVTMEDSSETATRRQLVQVLLRDVLRKSGIPAEWIDCQMMPVSSRTRGQGMSVRLIVKHWDERLMNYLFAFQQTLEADIAHFEPNAADWLHGISWQLDVDGDCPYAALPEKSYWADPFSRAELATRAAMHAAIPEVLDEPGFQSTTDHGEHDRARDLERLFAIRDLELDRDAAAGITPVGYEKTQPSAL